MCLLRDLFYYYIGFVERTTRHIVSQMVESYAYLVKIESKIFHIFSVGLSKQRSLCFQMPSSCLDHSRNGAVRSGLYVVYDKNKRSSYKVYCDLTSESTMAWTLVMSQTYQYHTLPQLRSPMFQDSPLNQESPRWDAYRLSLQRMNAVKSDSTHWRLTCNFPPEGLQYRDYARANFAEFDAINVKGNHS